MTDYELPAITPADLATVLRFLGYPDLEEQAAALTDVCRTPADLEAMLRDIGHPAPEQLAAALTEVYTSEEMARYAKGLRTQAARRRYGPTP